MHARARGRKVGGGGGGGGYGEFGGLEGGWEDGCTHVVTFSRIGTPFSSQGGTRFALGI